jgi:hypothetical protein
LSIVSGISNSGVVGGLVQTFQQKNVMQHMIITTSRIALNASSATCVETGIFIPMVMLNAPIISANPKKMKNPTKIPRITAATILSAAGLGAVSGIKSHYSCLIYIVIGISRAKISEIKKGNFNDFLPFF